jgi:hypothetical protein
MENHLTFFDKEKMKHLFLVDSVETIPTPKAGWYIEFYSNGVTKSVRVSSADEAYSLYNFLVNTYSPGIFNFSKYYEEEMIEFIIEYIGRDSNESPYSVSSVRIFHLFFDCGFYKKMYYREF